MRKLLFGLALSLSAQIAHADCPKIDFSKKDKDGIAFCPDLVKQSTAYTVFGCAIHQSTSWHEPSKGEVQTGRALLDAFKAKDYPALLANADKLKAQVCRVVDGDDKYLLVYAKPGVKDYVAPSFILRDAAKVSKLILVAPHMTSDGYFAAAPKALQGSHALMGFYSGHLKSLGQGRDADFSHSKKDLGYWLIKYASDLYPKHVWLHAHGMSATGHVLYRPLKGPLAKPYEQAIRKFTTIDTFDGFNAFYEIDGAITAHTGWYVKTEIPAKVYKNQPEILAKIFNFWEQSDWAWTEQPDPTPEAEPAGGEVGDEPGEDPFPVVDSQAFDEEDEDVMMGGDDTVDESEEPGAEVLSQFTETSTVWAPRQLPNLGDQDLICIATQYTSGPSIDPDRCMKTARSVADFYKRMSSGKKRLKPRVEVYKVDGPNTGNDGKVHDVFRKRYPKALFLAPNMVYGGSSHAGMRVAVINKYWSGPAHEVGHLLGLQHCGAWREDPKTHKVEYDGYGGGGCIMSRFFGNAFLAPNQFIYLGWYEKNQYAVKTSREAETYELRPIANLEAPGLAAVAIDPALLGQPRPGYIGLPPSCGKNSTKQCVAYYLGNAGASPKGWEGSSRVLMFGEEYKDPKNGLRITVLSRAGNKVTLKVSFDPVISATEGPSK